jgi:hypothetical protein
MTTQVKLATIFIALTFLGCKGPVETSAASTSSGTASGGAISGGAGAEGISAGGNASGTRVETVADDTLNNMPAYTVTLPAHWKFQGVLLQGGVALCDSLASSVWRATSPDGSSSMEQMPEMLWAWGNGPKPTTGCLPQNGPMSAQELLQHVAKMMGLDYAGPDAVPAALAQGVRQYQEAAANPSPFWAQHNLTPPKNTYDAAAAVVRYSKGGVAMRGRLTTFVQCTENSHAGFAKIDMSHPGQPIHTVNSGPSVVNKCTADISYLTAPEGQFAALVRIWDAPGMGFATNKDWGNAWVKRKAEEGQRITDAMIKGSWDRFNAQQKEIAHSMAVQQQQHDQFLDTMARGTQMSMDRAGEAMQARTTAASDVVDFALDRQTVMDTNTGRIYKVSNQLTPEDPLVSVHGNGTPR